MIFKVKGQGHCGLRLKILVNSIEDKAIIIETSNLPQMFLIGESMNPFVFEGQGSKVKVTLDFGIKSFCSVIYNMQLRGDATLALPLFFIKMVNRRADLNF